MKRRRRSRNKAWLVLAVVLVVSASLVGVGYYGTAFGVPDVSHLFFPAPADSATISNITLSSYPEIQDGFGGVSVSADVADQGTVKVQNTTMWVNDYLAGSCSAAIQPGHHAMCKVGKDVPCASLGSAPPYSVKVVVGFQDGKTSSTSGQVTSTILSNC